MSKKSVKTIEHTNALKNKDGRFTTKAILGLLMIGLLIGSSVYVYLSVRADFSTPGIFDIDGDICADPSPSTLPDWGQCSTSGSNGIFNGNGQVITSHLPAGTIPGTAIFFNDFIKSADLTVYSGSNKNNDPISAWHWLSFTSSLQAKDDLTHVYTLGINSPTSFSGVATGDELLFVGLERISPSGDSHIDIEFFQSAVGLAQTTPCTLSNPYCSFTGTRLNGDIIISMDFVVGGSLGSVTARSFSTALNAYGAAATLNATRSSGLFCTPLNTICAENNAAEIPSGPWLYLNSKSTNQTTVPTNGFTEIGVDISALGFGHPCIASILPKTRSSQSFTATLQDFVTPGQTGHCGANISIHPDKLNQVRASHTFTVNVTQQIGSLGSSPAPNGTPVLVTLTPTGGATPVVTANTCSYRIDGGSIVSGPGTTSGLCTVTFMSNTPGLVEGHANATVTINGSPFPAQTDGSTGNSVDAFKRFVDANIGISPSKVNQIGQPHTFTVNVTQNFGNSTSYVPVVGVKPSVLLTPSAPVLGETNNCASTGTDVNGKCTVTFSSNTPGTIVGSACVTFAMTAPNTGTLISPTIMLSRCTNGVNGDTGNATKRFVNMSIMIAPNATNSIFDPHTFTVTVTANTGTGVFGVSGINPVVTLTPSGATIIGKVDNCMLLGTNGAGVCTVTFSSSTAGTVTATATATATFSTSQGSITVTRSTDGNTFFGNSFGAMKTFIAGSFTWEKVDNLGQPLAGATFQVMRLCDFHVASQTCDGPIAPPAITFTVTSGTGFFSVTGLRLGIYQVRETIAPPGFTLDPTVKTAFVNNTNLNINIGVFSDQRPILKVTGFGYQNTLTGHYGQSNTTASGIVTYTVTIHNYGGAAGFFNITLAASLGGTGLGTLTCTGSTGPNTVLAGCMLTATNVPIAAAGNAGDTITFTLTAIYTNVPNTTTVVADLSGTYVATLGDGGIRTINGTPAEIKFTPQAN